MKTHTPAVPPANRAPARNTRQRRRTRTASPQPPPAPAPAAAVPTPQPPDGITPEGVAALVAVILREQSAGETAPIPPGIGRRCRLDPEDWMELESRFPDAMAEKMATLAARNPGGFMQAVSAVIARANQAADPDAPAGEELEALAVTLENVAEAANAGQVESLRDYTNAWARRAQPWRYHRPEPAAE